MRRFTLILIALLALQTAQATVTVSPEEIKRMNERYNELVLKHQAFIKDKHASIYASFGFGAASAIAFTIAANTRDQDKQRQLACAGGVASLAALVSSICYVVYEIKSDKIQVQINTCGVRVNF